MFRTRADRFWIALAGGACALALTGLVPESAAADPHCYKSKGHGHGRHRAPVAVRHVRPVPPQWCPTSSYLVYGGDPYWYRFELGAFFGGTRLNISFGEHAPEGFGYWDPYCDEWFESVEVYTTHCAHHRHRPALEIVHLEDDGYRRGEVRAPYGYPPQYGYR